MDSIAALLVSAALAVAPNDPDDSLDPVDFRRDIRPILSDKCFFCHGPDEAMREGGLRLDTADGLRLPLDSGALAVVAGSLEQSELYYRISSDYEAERMPPLESGKKLDAAEIELIRRWIEQGASWQQHWSLVAPVRPSPPEVSSFRG